MKISLRSKSKKVAETSASPAEQATGRQVVEADLIGKAIALVLGLCLVCGPLGLLVGLAAASSSSSPAPAPQAVSERGERERAGDFAARVVVAWGRATTQDSKTLDELVPSASSTFTSDRPTVVSAPRVASIVRSGQTWTVTVSGTVAGAARYFQVPVLIDGDQVAALALPMPVAGPEVVSPPSLDYGSSLSTSSPLGKSVAEFLSAYVAGAGDVSRYVSPGVDLVAVQPALGSAVKLNELRARIAGDDDPEAPPREGATVRVLAQVDITVAARQSLPATYTLTLKGRAGRWEISAIDSAPAVRAASQSPDASSGPSPNSATSNPAPEEE